MSLKAWKSALIASAMLYGLAALVACGIARADDLTVTWINATTYVNKDGTVGPAMPASDIASSTAWCGLSVTALTLSQTVTGPAQTAIVHGAVAGQTYVCAVVHTSKANATSDFSQPSAPVFLPLPAPLKPAAPSGVVAMPK